MSRELRLWRDDHGTYYGSTDGSSIGGTAEMVLKWARDNLIHPRYRCPRCGGGHEFYTHCIGSPTFPHERTVVVMAG